MTKEQGEALIEIERGHVVCGRQGWTVLSAERVAGLIQAGLAEAIEPPEWLRKLGRRYSLTLTTEGRSALGRWAA